MCVKALNTLLFLGILSVVLLCFCEQKVNPKTEEASDTPVGMMDVYQEFNELSEKFKIMKFKSKVRVNLSHGLYSMNVIFRAS